MRVLTTEEWAGVEKSYWETGTSIGFIFGLGVAMGYSDRFLLSILFQEALLLACLGFLPF